ncbi:hypothetical protein [Actinoallomurus rhizosphaericola]|uniref:hypothetical protein n=1 Tax=Actinoallomurus rhizosphaericola TaxID=2952536 RepID=UPI0020906A3B|nr:hypothetical protein [Actinoallomurus rhizosphaericola]MCO5992682.1 hypothetical protein [Actinoallomurus rhizosphaericola]
MSVELPLPQWARDAFGHRAGLIRRGIGESLSSAMENAQDSQSKSGTQKLHPFGFTLMSRKFEVLHDTFKDMDDVQIIKPAGTSYELVVISGHLLFPFKYAKDLSVNVMNARISENPPSGLVRTLFERFGPEPTMEQLPLVDLKLDGQHRTSALPIYLRTLAQLPEDTKLLLIAYACNAKAGLLNAWWGEAELLDKDGTLHWHHCDPVPFSKGLPSDGQVRGSGTGPTGTPDASKFDQGAMPRTSLTARPPLERKTDQVPPVSEVPESQPDADDERE